VKTPVTKGKNTGFIHRFGFIHHSSGLAWCNEPDALLPFFNCFIW